MVGMVMCEVGGGVYLELFLHVATVQPAVVEWGLGWAWLWVQTESNSNAWILHWCVAAIFDCHNSTHPTLLHALAVQETNCAG